MTLNNRGPRIDLSSGMQVRVPTTKSLIILRRPVLHIPYTGQRTKEVDIVALGAIIRERGGW